MGKISNESMDALFDGLTTEEPVGEGTSNQTKPSNRQKQGKKGTAKKESFLVRFNQDVLDKARIISGAHKIPISEIIDFALNNYIKKYEKKYGDIELTGHTTAADLLR